jgi:hypothetical protein
MHSYFVEEGALREIVWGTVMTVCFRKIFFVPLVSLLAGSSPASAGLIGTTANVTYDWPDLGDVLYSAGSALVVPGVRFLL